ncbi:ATP-binding cassette domain-containing protein [Candidatus Bathyarchaeota archaeon]|nr:ATP-binding cassette domain-containing protein [Candidatus Bathyarchaeota archaeon]
MKQKNEQESRVLKVTGLHKNYHLGELEVRALNDLSLEVKSGEFCSLMGPSGSGKSTLFNILGLLDTQTSGDVFINNINTMEMNERKKTRFRARELGFVFQFYNLVPVLTALENVALPLAALKIPLKKQQDESRNFLDLVGLGNRMDHKPHELSGGEQQRVCIARALVTRPSIVLADEPTGNLDQDTGLEIMELFKNLNEEKGQTFLIITHDPSIASMTDRIMYIEDGTIINEEMVVGTRKTEKAISITDQALNFLQDGQEKGIRVSLERLGRVLDLDKSQVEIVVERILRIGALSGYIEDNDFVIEKLKSKGLKAT